MHILCRNRLSFARRGTGRRRTPPRPTTRASRQIHAGEPPLSSGACPQDYRSFSPQKHALRATTSVWAQFFRHLTCSLLQRSDAGACVGKAPQACDCRFIKSLGAHVCSRLSRGGFGDPAAAPSPKGWCNARSKGPVACHDAAGSDNSRTALCKTGDPWKISRKKEQGVKRLSVRRKAGSARMCGQHACTACAPWAGCASG